MILSKEAVIDYLLNDLESKISDVKITIEHLKESLNSETKSSMGDKYETSRSMIQTEIDNYKVQFANWKNNIITLKSISRLTQNDTVDFGSLVLTDKGLYFIGLGIGIVNINEQRVYCISLNSPIGKLFSGLKTDETVIFNNEKIKILSIK